MSKIYHSINLCFSCAQELLHYTALPAGVNIVEKPISQVFMFEFLIIAPGLIRKSKTPSRENEVRLSSRKTRAHCHQDNLKQAEYLQQMWALLILLYLLSNSQTESKAPRYFTLY